MRTFRNMPINRKLSAIILMTCTAVLLVAGSAMMLTEYVTTRRSMVETTTLLADLLARNSTAPLQFNREEDIEEVEQLLSALVEEPSVAAAAVYDADGELFGRFVRETSEQVLPARAPEPGYQFGDGWLTLARPIITERERIGTIYIVSSLQRTYRQLAIYGGVMGLILIATIVATIGVSSWLRRPIAEPILALAEVARQVAARKDYTVRAKKQSEDEIGLLTDAFNQMLGEIGSANESLRGANAQLAQAKDAAEAASRAKDQFLAVLSHELRTPLTPALLTISLLQEYQGLPADVQDDLQTIRRHVELEARLIDDLLDLTRITRGKLQLNLENVDVHVLVRDAVKISLADRMGDVQMDLKADRHRMRADAGRLLQVFWNLMNNAHKFTAAGKAIRIVSRNTENGLLRIEVADSGAGISAESLPKIFNAFEQGESPQARKTTGLGLGLAIAKALVEMHGGRIYAHSNGANTGATFAVELPVGDGSGADAETG